jgi:hypothetical protein
VAYVIPQFFFPYEFLFMAAGVGFFFLVYRYLVNSLPNKKEIVFSKIINNYSNAIRTYEGSLSAYLNNPNFRPTYDDVMKQSLWREKEVVLTDLFSQIIADRALMEGKPLTKEVISDFNYLIRMHKQKEISENIRVNLDNFRLRDLEKINKNPEIIETVYWQRVGTRGKT